MPIPTEPTEAYWSAAADALGREGSVTVWDDHGHYVGCLGADLWRWLLTVESERAGRGGWHGE